MTSGTSADGRTEDLSESVATSCIEEVPPSASSAPSTANEPPPEIEAVAGKLELEEPADAVPTAMREAKPVPELAVPEQPEEELAPLSDSNSSKLKPLEDEDEQPYDNAPTSRAGSKPHARAARRKKPSGCCAAR